MDVAPARRVGRAEWINARTVTGLLLFGLSIVLGQRVMRGAEATTPVWVAASDLPAGTTIAATDVDVAAVRLPADVIGSYVTAATEVAGAVLGRAVRRGELIPSAWIAAPAGVPGRVMTIPVAPERAAGGGLRPGDLVDVIATFGAGEPGARTVVVARAVEVVDVVTAAGLVVGESSVVGVTVAVSPDEAVRLAYATRTADVDVALVTGAGSAPTEPVTAGDF